MLSIFTISSKWIGKFPFIGKFFTKGIFSWTYSADQIHLRIRRGIYTLIFLVLFICGHLYQGKMGIDSYSINPSTIAIEIICLTYALANFVVVYTQIILFIKMIINLIRWNKLSKTKKEIRGHKLAEFSGAHFILCLIVTLGGQIVFLLAM